MAGYFNELDSSSVVRPTILTNPDVNKEFVVAVQLLSLVQLFVTLWTAASQAFLSFTISPSLLKFMSIGLVTLSYHLILGCPLLLLPSIFLSIRVFSSESALHIRWPKYWSFSLGLYEKKGKRTNFPLLSPVNCTCFHFHLLNLYSDDTVHLRNIQSPKAPGVTQ